MVAGVLAAAGILVMVGLALRGGMALGAVPFATSIALVAGAPDSPPASTRSILIGHLLSATIGLAAGALFPANMVVAAAAVGVSVAGMMALRALHPPAAISPLIIMQTSPSVTFLLSPVLVGALLVVLLARVSGVAHQRFDVVAPPTPNERRREPNDQ